MSEWKNEQMEEIIEIWKWRLTVSCGFGMSCGTCGGSTSSCPCAQKRFIDKMTPEYLQELQEKRDEYKEAERKWKEEHKELK